MEANDDVLRAPPLLAQGLRIANFAQGEGVSQPQECITGVKFKQNRNMHDFDIFRQLSSTKRLRKPFAWEWVPSAGSL